MSINCIRCVSARRTGADLLCDTCRRLARSRPLPDATEGPARNLRDIPLVLAVSGYTIGEWHAADDGQGPPEAIGIRLHLAGQFDGGEVLMRIKSRAETDRLIAALVRHRDNVWDRSGELKCSTPPPPQPSP